MFWKEDVILTYIKLRFFPAIPLSTIANVRKGDTEH